MAATALAKPQRPVVEPESDERSGNRESLWLAVGVTILAVYPFFDEWLGIDRLGSWEAIFVYIILAMGLNIVVGYAGLLDLGYAAFFAIGAYTTGFLTSPSSYFVKKGW